MPLLKVNPTQRKILAITMVLAVLVAAWFLRHYIMLILFSALVVILFNPVYHWLLAKGRSPQKAALYTMLISALAVIIPVTLVSIVTFFQIERLVSTLTSGSYPHNLTQLATSIIDGINKFLANVGISYHLSIDAIAKAISEAAQNFGKALLGGLLSSVSGFFGFITTAIIYMYVFISMIIHQDKILETLKGLNPLGDTASNLYFERVGAMTKATVRGQFIIALCQGTVSAAALALVGFHNLFFFFWMLLTVMSVIPLGAGIVTIPIGVALILTGHYWQGVLVIINHLVIVTNIDNVLRPKLVPRKARLDAALMILAVFAGLGLFGFFGIVLGPVLMIILVTTLQMYLEVFTDKKSIDRSADSVPERGLFQRLQFWNKA
jgi:predicted PurR-regulated permease PerM